jgi:hypothetical protein
VWVENAVSGDWLEAMNSCCTEAGVEGKSSPYDSNVWYDDSYEQLSLHSVKRMEKISTR